MSLEDLSQAIADYRNGRLSLDAFEDWFRTNSRGMFGDAGEVTEACVAVETAFSMLRHDRHEEAFRDELAIAVRPFVVP